MKTMRMWLLRLAGLLPNSRREGEFSDEIESHLQMEIDDLVRGGMTPGEARRQAIRNLGGMERTKLAYRDQNSVPLLENLVQDARFALRQLRKNPGFTATAILMLSLGMCASIAIFAFVDAALAKPLPYRNPQRLAAVYEKLPRCEKCNLSFLDYLDWKKLNKSFSSMDVYQGRNPIVTTSSGAEKSRAGRVSDGFFRTLGIAPILGRNFYAGEDLPASPRTVLLSYSAWQKRFAGRTDILGQTVTLDGEPNTIIGVLPQDFHFALIGPAEFWVSLHAGGSCEDRRSCHNLYGVGRLKDGVSIESAAANMVLIAQQLEKGYPDSNRGQGANIMQLSEAIVGEIRPILLVLLGGAGLLLLIACVNIASLLLLRSEGRRREMAVRSALGASSGRLIRQFVTEGLVLVAAASALGLLGAHWAMQLLIGLIPEYMMADMPYLQGLGLNLRVTAFGAAIAILAAVLFALTPALRLSSPDMREGMAEGSRGSAGNTWRRLGSKLVVVELATAMVLLVGAGLLGKSLYLLLKVDLGMKPDHLATLRVAIPKNGNEKMEQRIAIARNIVGEIASLPGVQSVGITDVLPVSFNGNTDWIRFVGKPYNGEHNEVNGRQVSPGYFKTIQARLLQGRYFTESDDASKPKIVIINKMLAKQYFPGEDPIGKKFGDTSLTPKSIREVVGVIDDVRDGALDSEIWAAEYAPFNQDPDLYFAIVVRTSQDEGSLLPAMTATIRKIDAGFVTTDTVSMMEKISSSPTAYIHRSSAWLVGAFAAMALLLGVVGLYGVIAYSVSQRTREIGVRMALGAQPGAVYRLVLLEAGWLIGAGIVSGLLCSIALSSLLRQLLFGVKTWDWMTLTGVAIVLGISALLASYLPARRAAAVNPLDALRAE